MSDRPTDQTDKSIVIEADPVLGEVIGHYPSERLRPLIIAGILIAVGGLLVSFTIGSLPYEWSPAVAMGIMAVMTVLLAWYALHNWNREIVLYELGFSYREGAAEIQFIYAEIDSIRLRAEQRAYFGGLIKRAIYRFTVFTTSGETFTITNLYRRTADLGAKLQERVNRELRPHTARKLAKGDAVRFSDTLRLSVNGLHESGRDLPWSAFGGYQIGGRKLTLYAADGSAWFALPLYEYDNITILLDLLKDRKAAANG